AGRELTARAEGQLIRAAQYKALRNVECGRAARGTAIIDVLVPGYSIGLARRAGGCIVNRLAKGVDGHYPGASLPGLLQLCLKTVVVGGAEVSIEVNHGNVPDRLQRTPGRDCTRARLRLIQVVRREQVQTTRTHVANVEHQAVFQLVL